MAQASFAFDEMGIADSIRLEERSGKYFVVHEVEQGETLFSLSKRYSSSVSDIRMENQLEQNGIDIGQIVLIPILVERDIEVAKVLNPSNRTHTVRPKETLYSIARMYNVAVNDLKRLNDLASNDLNIGQVLTLGEEKPNDTIGVVDDLPAEVLQKKEYPEGLAHSHYVQPGETVSSISRRFEVSPDSIIVWNQLKSSQLSIGSKLIIRREVNLDSLNYKVPAFSNTTYGSKKWREENDAPNILWEEGVAGVIEEILKTRKFLALHRDLPLGSEVSVVNLMNNKKILVKVVGKLPDTGLNRNVMIRLTPVTFRKLGIVDSRSRVKISYRQIPE